jgi:hypothetical protein
MRMRQAAPRDEHCDLEVGDLKRTLTEFADELEVRIADDRDVPFGAGSMRKSRTANLTPFRFNSSRCKRSTISPPIG